MEILGADSSHKRNESDFKKASYFSGMYTDVTLSYMLQTAVTPALLIIMCALSHDVEVLKRGFAVTATLPISHVRTGSEKKFRAFAFFFYLWFPFYLLSRRENTTE